MKAAHTHTQTIIEVQCRYCVGIVGICCDVCCDCCVGIVCVENDV